MVETVLPTISDFIPEIVCLGVDCIVCGIVYTAYVFTNRAITSVCSAAKFDLDKQVYVISSIYKSLKIPVNYARIPLTWLPFNIISFAGT